MYLKRLAIFLLLMAGLSALLEMAFYGSIDAAGVLQESFFLPMAWLCGFLGLISLGGYFIWRKWLS
ncbi:DUF3955 domain-containing protein [Cohaesibacter gelatinilyticus]|uniref:DUF3955 domain-containing protein n=1 Tax=Cohaesibacter gelatinilyticus TaxID=372072 RepID=A0A285PIQ0_9HYPH|nr:DUF3955 domain-containing protein [Cohaesibacter gelatinilyticus]SNZ21127.1 Protein of unknown function [Cohaesibacter gelatinilyticus]